mgnify:FL=1
MFVMLVSSQNSRAVKCLGSITSKIFHGFQTFLTALKNSGMTDGDLIKVTQGINLANWGWIFVAD